MEEELNENELEERLYAMIHYVDGTQANVNVNTEQDDACKAAENAPRSTLRRYWRTSGDQQPRDTHNPYQKVNHPRETPASKSGTTQNGPKEEKNDGQATPPDLNHHSPQNFEKTIEILENDDDRIVELQSSDEDEVIEVELPPKPTITIDSSDDETNAPPQVETPVKEKPKSKDKSNGEREISASPVPSVVSSVSDEFIRGDCIALNISSRKPDHQSFDFSLHGSDLMNASTPAKKKKKKKSKERTTSTPVAQSGDNAASIVEDCFATPKSKAKNKKQKSNVTARSFPSADVYDSDSNQSAVLNRSYTVTDKSLPSADVYESDSNTSEIGQPHKKPEQKKTNDSVNSSGSSVSLDSSHNNTTNKTNKSTNESVVDLTSEDYITLDVSGSLNFTQDASEIEENIVMGNVTGFMESEDYGDESVLTNPQADNLKLGSTKVPAILYEDLDFDNLKGKDRVCKRRKYSLTTLRAEMDRFYNESWGGEDFNHREIQKYMSRDKSLWVIDPKDRMPSQKKKVTCNYCNRAGHRDDSCHLKPAVCHMCGAVGHYEPRCPRKICVNCGSPNYMYSTMCRNCSQWGRIQCLECGQRGHPASHCPDLWRRYHSTIDENTPLEENHQMKKSHQQFCSGCSIRGHMIHNCTRTLPFSGLPINSPFVAMYRPVYKTTINNNPQSNNQKFKPNRSFPQDATISSASPLRNDPKKRQSKSPTVHETHVPKKRNLSVTEIVEPQVKAPVISERQRKRSQSKDIDATRTESVQKVTKTMEVDPNKAPDFIPINSNNHDNKGHMIQDNEISNTSDVVTSARVYISKDILDKLKTEDGEKWVKDMTAKLNLEISFTDANMFLNIKGIETDQEAFQHELRDWTKSKNVPENPKLDVEENHDHGIPRSRFNIIQLLTKAIESLNEDLGDPNAIYKELLYLQNHHKNLLQQKAVSPKKVSNNRTNINRTLTRLNKLLIGQAGLADGLRHIAELKNLLEQLISLRQKQIPPAFRKLIGEHYHCIFTPVQRNDYAELIQTFYGNNRPKPKFNAKKNRDKSFQISPRPPKKNKQKPIPPPQQNNQNANEKQNKVIEIKGSDYKNYHIESTRRELIECHRRLFIARPVATGLRKTKQALCRQLHTFIASLGGNHRNEISSKFMKKIRKTQKQAQTFLSNNV